MEKQYLPKSKSILVLSGEEFKKLAANNATDTSAGTTQTTPIDRNSLLYKYERWGLYNDFPQKWNKAIESNETLAAAIYWVAKAIISGGVVYGEVVIDELTGKEKMIPSKYDQRIEDFFKRSNIKRYFKECSNEFWRFWNAFPEFILTKDRKEIYSLNCQESTFCRFETQNENGVIPRVFISANWHLGDTEVANYVTPVPCLDPYQEPVAQMKNGSSYKYILPLQGVDSGRVYYQYAPHHTLLNGKWLDLANEIANYKLSLIRNQMTVKYIIYVHEKYWTSKYADWNNSDIFTSDEKINKINELKKEIEDKLTGTKNAGKSIHIPLAYDEFTNQTIKLIEIEPIKDEIKEGAWIEESLESVSHILFALGLDGSLVGNTPGKTSFSGSDKRESFNIFITNSKTEQDTILEPLEVVRDYNGWNPKLKFWFKNYYLQTLDAVAPAARNTTVPK